MSGAAERSLSQPNTQVITSPSGPRPGTETATHTVRPSTEIQPASDGLRLSGATSRLERVLRLYEDECIQKATKRIEELTQLVQQLTEENEKMTPNNRLTCQICFHTVELKISVGQFCMYSV